LKLRISIVGITFAVVLCACNEKEPRTEKECLLESKVILNAITKDDFSKGLSFLTRYEAYAKCREQDFDKEYRKLHEFLKNKKLSGLRPTFKRDSYSLDFGGVTSQVNYYEIDYFYFDSLTSEEVRVCDFRYSIALDEKKYELSSFEHHFRQKLIPIIPSVR